MGFGYIILGYIWLSFWIKAHYSVMYNEIIDNFAKEATTSGLYAHVYINCEEYFKMENQILSFNLIKFLLRSLISLVIILLKY